MMVTDHELPQRNTCHFLPHKYILEHLTYQLSEIIQPLQKALHELNLGPSFIISEPYHLIYTTNKSLYTTHSKQLFVYTVITQCYIITIIKSYIMNSCYYYTLKNFFGGKSLVQHLLMTEELSTRSSEESDICSC